MQSILLEENNLTKTELSLVEILLKGLSNKEAADLLFVSEKTVKFHITSIYKKLGVQTRAQFLVKFRDNKVEKKIEVEPVVPTENKEGLPMGNMTVVPRDNAVIASGQRVQEEKVKFINDTFKIGETVNQLHTMMKDVTKDGVNPSTVNAACNCAARLNETIQTAIQAARFLNER